MDSEWEERFNSVHTKINERSKHPAVTAGLLLFLALHIAMLVVGIIKRDECPVQDKIPIFLIVAGVVGITSKALSIGNRWCENCCVSLIVFLLYIFEGIWLICGSVWVYSLKYKPDNCDEAAYLTTFWLLTIHWICLVLSFIIGCCCCGYCRSSEN